MSNLPDLSRELLRILEQALQGLSEANQVLSENLRTSRAQAVDMSSRVVQAALGRGQSIGSRGVPAPSGVRWSTSAAAGKEDGEEKEGDGEEVVIALPELQLVILDGGKRFEILLSELAGHTSTTKWVVREDLRFRRFCSKIGRYPQSLPVKFYDSDPAIWDRPAIHEACLGLGGFAAVIDRAIFRLYRSSRPWAYDKVLTLYVVLV